MNRIYNIVIVGLFVTLCSCEKVIELKLTNSDPKYVIEGVITNEAGMCKVFISQTKPFDENNEFEGVADATVKITDNGNEISLFPTSAGVYTTNLVNGTPGHVYQLSVTVNGQDFTATSTMPQPVLMDSLYISPGPFGQFKFATVSYTDPAGSNNNYRFVQYKNGVKDPSIFWENDEFTDDQKVTIRLDGGVTKKDDPRNLLPGDVVTVEMLCIDEAVRKYWYSLKKDGGDGTGNSATPSNPVTNIQGGALGYFSAHAINRLAVVVP